MRVDEFVLRSEVEHEALVRISAKASQFVSEIHIVFTKDNFEHSVDAKSLLGMLVIPHKPGTSIRITAKGRDEEEALERMIELFAAYV